MDNTSGTESLPPRQSNLPGDPNCPICHGVGFVRQDLPVGHPDFGKLQLCVCRQTEVVRSEREALYRLSNLEAFRNMRFETFQTRGRRGLGDRQIQSLEQAYQVSRHFAQTLQGWLLLMGGYGCGKTHLAAAIANFAVEQGVPVLFLTVPDLLDWLRFAFESTDENFEARFEEIRHIRLLVLDDLGTQNSTPWAAEKLYQIINYRYLLRLPTVITTNLTLDDLDGRIRSRLMDADLVTRVEIQAPDYRVPLSEEAPSPFSSLDLLADRTFGNFSLRENEPLSREVLESLQKAYEAAMAFAESPQGWLVLMGDYGCGKTHLAAAIGNYRKGLGEAPLFVVVPDLLDHLRATFGPASTISYDRLFEQVRNAPLLILDDLGTQSATPWAREKLYQIFNHRYNARLPTVITTSSTLEDLDPRIRSRMLDLRLCRIHAILAPAYRVMPVSPESKGGRSTRRARQA